MRAPHLRGFFLRILPLGLGLLLLVGCDRDGTPRVVTPAPMPPVQMSVTGYAVNGPLDGATVRIFGADGQQLGSAITGADGAYHALVSVSPPYRIEVVGGLLDGEPYAGALRAPCETNTDCNITPFTTVLTRLMDDHGYNAGDARAQLALRLTFDYDPFVRALIERLPVEEFDLDRARTFLDGGKALDTWVDAMLAWVDPSVQAEEPPAGIRSGYTVIAHASEGGAMGPAVTEVDAPGRILTFSLAPNTGYRVGTVSGCDGSLDGLTYSTGPITGDCTINVTFTRLVYTVATNAGEGGEISPTSRQMEHGDSDRFTLHPAAGFVLETVSGCAGRLDGNTYITGAVTAACTVTASFSRQQYTVNASASEGGSISPSTQRVSHGMSAQLTLAAEAGYAIDSVTGCDGSLSGTRYTTGPLTADCSINATFSRLSYSVIASAGEGGSITPPSRSVAHGQTTSFTVTPASGYDIDSVGGCGGTLSGNTYTTGAVTGACAVTASFALKQYTVSASAGEGGSITPPTRSMTHGQTTSFTITPDSGYDIDSVSGCGGTLSGNTYTTGVVTGTCAVSASFSLKQYIVSASAGEGGSISPATRTVAHGETTSFTITPASGYDIDWVSGCGGTLSDNTYITDAITADCAVSAVFTLTLAAPMLSASAGDGEVTVSWASVTDAEGYDLYYAQESFGPANYNSYAGGALLADVTSPQIVSELSNGTQYFFSAAAKAGSARRFSALVSATPVAACFGVSGDDAQVCSGNGTCPVTDTCECAEGFIGEQCNVELKFPDGSREFYFPTTTGRVEIIQGPDLPAGETYVWKFEILGNNVYWPGREGFNFGVVSYPLDGPEFHEVGDLADEWAYRGRDGRTFTGGVDSSFGNILRNTGDQIMFELNTVTGVLNIYTRRGEESEFTLEGGRPAFTGVFPIEGRVLRPAVSGICWQTCGIRFIE